MDLRKLLLDKLASLDAIDEDHVSVVALYEYFLGNTEEDSIVPNQWGEGWPSIIEIDACFEEIEAREDVEGGFVGLHQSWSESLDDKTWRAAENIHVFSSAPQEIADQWVFGLESDGIIAGGRPCAKHKAAPEPPAGPRLCAVYWDQELPSHYAFKRSARRAFSVC